MEQYTVTGMSCAACQARVEKAVSKLDGVTSCNVSLLTNTLAVEGDVAGDRHAGSGKRDTAPRPRAREKLPLREEGREVSPQSWPRRRTR